MKALTRQMARAGMIAAVAVAGGAAGSALGSGSAAHVKHKMSTQSSRGAAKLVSASGPTYLHNRAGQSYGSAAQAASRAQFPDLIAVIGTNHVAGYVLKSELQAASGGDVSSPAQAIAWDNNGAFVAHAIPVYAVNGTTQVGTFTIEPASAGPQPSGTTGTSGATSAVPSNLTGK